ncbi:MAG: 2-C-methyl-D-erythritol 2,4-cyclodiphosphate synthase [Actinomycetota bacterium]
MRIGHGFDAHAFVPGRPLVLGGVTIEHPRGLTGHSDADVVAHAIADALLGAAAMGDLGRHFPPDERWKNASGATILEATASLLRHAGFEVVNVDATVVAEAPRLAPHLEAMISIISAALSLSPGAVSVKATSTDGLGFTGRGEGAACFAVALVRSRKVP